MLNTYPNTDHYSYFTTKKMTRFSKNDLEQLALA